MNKFQNIKYANIEMLETLAETHEGSTSIELGRHEGELIVCKKIKKQGLLKDSKSVEHVKNEKQALIHFNNNEHICSIHGTEQDEEHVYLFLEAVRGLPIHKLLQMTGPLNEPLSKVILVQVALILKELHEAGYIYRDVKASNFMIDKNGLVKMVDLGLAKKIDRDRTFTICGTTHAMPPEAHKSTGYSYEFDYYSFGVLVYELLTGKAPFGYGNSNKNIIEDVEQGITQKILDPIANSDAKDLVRRLVVRFPEQRLGMEGGFPSILKHPFLEEGIDEAIGIYRGQVTMGKYDERYSLYVSEIEDFGIDEQKYEQMAEDDPFSKFL